MREVRGPGDVALADLLDEALIHPVGHSLGDPDLLVYVIIQVYA